MGTVCQYYNQLAKKSKHLHKSALAIHRENTSVQE